jgi:aminopeptidase YwaD
LTLPDEIAATGVDIPLISVNRFAYEDILAIVGEKTDAIIPLGTTAAVATRPYTKTQNIIGLKKAAKPTDRTIYVTSHYDSVLASPGANDNGSGVVMMIAIARAFAEVETDYNIAFIAFGAEEIGLKGARQYVSDLTSSGEIENAVANYNMDMIATSQEDCQYIFMNSSVDKDAPVDSIKLETYVTAISRLAAKKVDFDLDYYHVIYDTTTDHYAFHEAGVPAVEYDWRANLEGDAFEAYYHTYYDDIEHNFSLDRLKLQGDIIALAIYMDATGN